MKFKIILITIYKNILRISLFCYHKYVVCSIHSGATIKKRYWTSFKKFFHNPIFYIHPSSRHIHSRERSCTWKALGNSLAEMLKLPFQDSFKFWKIAVCCQEAKSGEWMFEDCDPSFGQKLTRRNAQMGWCVIVKKISLAWFIHIYS